MNKFISSIVICFSVLLFASCAGQDMDDILSEEYNARMLNVFIYDKDLVGDWEVSALIINEEVDFNMDGVASNNLVAQTSCFDKSTITFNGDKTFSATNYSLSIRTGEDGDVLTCGNEKITRGDWSLKDDILSLYIRLNGVEVEQKRHVILTEDAVLFEVNRAQSREMVYDHRNSDEIFVVAMEYVRPGK